MEAGRAHFLLLCSLLVVFAFQTHAAVVETGQECDGMGQRFCNEAHRAEECPEPCRLKACMGNSPSEVHRAGAKRPPWRDALDWEELALSGLYEYVYTDEDYMCLSSCWKEPWDATCVLWEPFWGSKYCKRLACEHDSYNRYSGCHKDSEGIRKKPWHKPTCTECAHVFPAACGSELREYMQPEVSAYLEQKRIAVARDLESSARLYCYQKYFRPLVPADSSSAVSPGSQAGVPDISNDRRDTLHTLENEERLVCPQPQCLTKNLGLLQQLVLPWYLRSSQGSCSWNGCRHEATILHPAAWCRESASSCIQCGSTWCPPADAPASWLPLTMQSFQVTIEDLTLSRQQKRQSQSKQGPEEKDGHQEVDRSMCDDSATVVSGLSYKDVEGLPWYLE